jgi:hypothetical protein
MSRFQVRAVVVLTAVALLAGACGGNGSAEAEAAETENGSAEAETAETQAAAYLESVDAIMSDSDAIIEETFDAVFVGTEGVTFESLLPEFSDALGTVIATERDALALFEALDPPEMFVADHEQVIEAMVDQIDAQTRQRAAADAGDTELISQIDVELRSIDRESMAGLSPQLVEYLVGSDGGLGVAALFVDLEVEEVEYLDAVATGWDEFRRRNQAFGEALERSYSSNERLLLALLDAGAGEAFAAVRAVIVEIDPPQSYVDGHAQLLAYLDETVALDTAIAEAAESGDVVAFEVANFQLGLAGNRFALEAPASLVAVNQDPADLAEPEDLPGGAYGEALWQELQRFRILALRPQTNTGVFVIISDDKLAESLAITTPTVIQLTEEAATGIEALTPPAEFEAGHERVLTYLRELVELRQSILRAATAGDLETLRTYGELGSFAAERAETEIWCAARAELADDPIEPITVTFFRPFGVATAAELCTAG